MIKNGGRSMHGGCQSGGFFLQNKFEFQSEPNLFND